MSSLVAEVMPFAIAGAISPAVLTVEVLILASGVGARGRAWAFALGGTIFAALFVTVSVLLLGQLPTADTGTQSTAERVVKGVLAGVLMAMAVRQLLPRKTPEQRHVSRLESMVEGEGTARFVLVGLAAMALNASTLVMVLAGAHRISTSTAPDDAKLAAALLIFGFACLPLVLPVLAVTVFGHHADSALLRLNEFTATHNRAINGAILLFFCALLVWSALKP